MITFVHHDSFLSVANGFNSIKAIDFIKQPLYCMSGICKAIYAGTELLDSYLITLSDGSSFISFTSEPKIQKHYSYMKPYSGTKIRYIDNYFNIKNSQRFMIYNYYNVGCGYIVPIELDKPDIIKNLKSVSYDEYKKFLKNNYHKSIGFSLINKLYLDTYGVYFSQGSRNGLFSGITNSELIEICKTYKNKFPEINSVRMLLKKASEDGLPIPKSFSKYRFGGNKTGYDTLQSIVYNGLEYSEQELKSENIDNILKDLKLKDINRKTYLKNLELKIVSSEYLGKDKFIRIKSENGIGLITKFEDTDFNNVTGVYLL